MYRRRTVEALVRQHHRETEQLLAVIREQNDRIMYLADKPWLIPPTEMQFVEPADDDSDRELLDLVDDVAQLPYDE